VPWLAVTGTTKWGAGRDLPTYAPGVYEVSEEIAVIARRDAPPRVIVCDERPAVTRGEGLPPLTLNDLKVGMDDGVRLKREDIPDIPIETMDDDEPVVDLYPCEFCKDSFPTEAPLRRHIRLHHEVQHARITAEEQAEADRLSELKAAAERLRLATEADLHPAEREVLDPDLPGEIDSLLEWPT
jgi:hypothetical protein